jgi:hypothetical protein
VTGLDLVLLQVGNILSQAKARFLEVTSLVHRDLGAAEDANRRDVIVEAWGNHGNAFTRAYTEFLASEVGFLEEAGTAAPVLVVTVIVPILIVTVAPVLVVRVIAILRAEAPYSADHSENKQEKSERGTGEIHVTPPEKVGP